MASFPILHIGFRRALSGVLVLGLAACGAATPPPPTPVPPPTPSPTAVPATARPSPTPQPTPTAPVVPPTAAPTATAGPDFTPAGTTVWNTEVGTSRQTGTCAGGPILPVYGLVQIVNDKAALAWKDQQAEFTLARERAGVWRYEGPSRPVPGMLKLIVTFVDDKTLKIQRELTPQSDPGCTNVVEYSGRFQWSR